MAFIILEGSSKFVSLTVLRDLAIFEEEIVLEYATSDLTAAGVDSAKFASCSILAPRDRGHARCGDYEQTAGLVTIPAGEVSGGFTVNIVDDQCRQIYMRFIQVSGLSSPSFGD